MAQRFVVRAVALLSAKLSEKRESSEMISLNPTSSACVKQGKTLARNTGQTAEKKEDSLTEGVKNNSEGETC